MSYSLNKPKYLLTIQNKICESLKQIKQNFKETTESRKFYIDAKLQIYKEAFSSLIENSITSADILKNIQEAYEDALKVRDDLISFQHLQARLFGFNERKKEIEDSITQWRERNEHLKMANVNLNLEISKLKNENAKETAEHFSEYLNLMRERDARYTLYFENVALHMRVKELDGSSGGVCEEAGDPVLLRIALERCREQLIVAQKKLHKYSHDYAESVPRVDYDSLEAKLVQTNKQIDELRGDLEEWKRKYKRLQALKDSIEEELNELKERSSELDRAGTPRPQWQVCADFIVGGRDRWQKMSSGLSSRDTLRVLLKELGPAAETDHMEYFQGLGTEPAIPPYLRHEGPVRNLRLSRRQVCVIVHDIWRRAPATGHTVMQDYLTHYFTERYQQPTVRAEWAYNLCSSVEQMLDDPYLKLFYGCVRGHLSSDIYFSHRAQWIALKDALYRASRDGESISLDDFEKATRLRFPLKSDADVKALLDVVRRQLKLKLNCTDISLDKLFYENEEGFQRIELARELYRQRQTAQDKYIREVVAELGTKRAGNKLISVEHLKRAFAIVDPNIDNERMERNVCWAFSISSTREENVAPIPLRILAGKLAAGDIERVGPRYKRAKRRTHLK